LIFAGREFVINESPWQLGFRKMTGRQRDRSFAVLVLWLLGTSPKLFNLSLQRPRLVEQFPKRLLW
jgi:hypothetical protein